MKAFKYNFFALSLGCAFLAAQLAMAAEPSSEGESSANYENAYPEEKSGSATAEAWKGAGEILLGATGQIVAGDVEDTSTLRGTKWSTEPEDVAQRVATHEIARADPEAKALLKERAMAENAPIGMSDDEIKAKQAYVASKSHELGAIDNKISRRAEALLANLEAGKKVPTLLQRAADLNRKNRIKAKLIRGVGYIFIGDGIYRAYSAVKENDPGYSPAVASSHSAASSPKRGPATEPQSMSAAQTKMSAE